MAVVQIPNLPVAIALGGEELMEAVQAGTSVRVSVAQLADFMSTFMRLEDLADVNVAEGAGIDGYALTWNDATSRWVATSLPTRLDQMSDVDVTEGAGIDGYYLTWDNGASKWVAAEPPALSSLPDVSVTEGPAIDGQYLKYSDSSSAWVAGKPTEIPTNSVSASGSLTLYRSVSEIQIVTLTNDVSSFTITGWPAAGILARVVLRVDNTGAYNINSWPATTKWVGGLAPTVTSGAGKIDIFILTTFDGGVTLYGNVVGQDYS